MLNENTENSAEDSSEIVGLSRPSFWLRLSTGWTAAAIPLTVLWAIYVFNQTHNFTFAVRRIDLQALGLMLIIGTLGVFIIAWPVESLWIKTSKRTLRAVGIYALVILVLGGILALYLNTFDTAESVRYYGHLGLMIAGVATAVTMLVACTGRAIYPFLLRYRKITIVLGATILILATLAGFAPIGI